MNFGATTLMFKNFYSLGVILFVTTSLLLTACSKTDNKATETAKATAKQVSEKPTKHSMPNHVMKKKENKSNLDLAKDDIAFLTQLGLMRGHLFVGHELYKAGYADQAKTHMKHPKMELYADVEPAFAPRGATGFADELTALAVAVEQEKSNEIVDQSYNNIVKAIAKTGSFVKAETSTPVKQLELVVKLLEVAGEEYSEGIVDGKAEKPHEYQDAYGFTQICKKILSNIKTDNDNNKKIIKEAQTIVEQLTPMWPGLVPPSRLDFDASQIYGATAKIEILILGLK